MQQGNYLAFPENGDRGTVFCPAITENFQTLDVHKHDGLTSDKISAKDLTKGTVNLVIADWSAVVDTGDYKQEVTLPSGYEFDTAVLKFVIDSGSEVGHEFYPTVIKTAVNKFDLYMYSNAYDVKVVVV
jgi:hypothetical protein